MDEIWDPAPWEAPITSPANPAPSTNQLARPKPQPHAKSLPDSVGSKAGKHTADEWKVQRPEITRLYEINTLSSVRKIMREQNGFDATPKQYKDRIKKWGLNKNIQTDEMEAIIRKQQTRSVEGNKLSAFRVRKRHVSQEKINRFIKDHSTESISDSSKNDIFESTSLPATPGGISCYTPSDTEPLTPQAASSPPVTPIPTKSSSHQILYSNSFQFGDAGPASTATSLSTLIEEDESALTGQFSIPSSSQEYYDDECNRNLSLQSHMSGAQIAVSQMSQMYLQHHSYADHTKTYQQLPYSQPLPAPVVSSDNVQNPVQLEDHHYKCPNVTAVEPVIPQSQMEPPEGTHEPDLELLSLADMLGDLSIDVIGSAPYESSKKKNTSVEDPVFDNRELYEHIRLPLYTTPDLQIGIPSELMLEEGTALHYFDIYFKNIHSYLPVLNKTLFYQQWASNRESISPLILAAIFAIAAKLTGEPSQGQQWLAMAKRHEDFFMDMPRLSTVQGLLILLKARESAPKKGYRYQTWMRIVQIVQMAKDLGLDEHYGDHQAGYPCCLSPLDCIAKTRLWQACYVYEAMIGSSQGRMDHAVDQDSVDLNISRLHPVDDPEHRNFIYFTRAVDHVRTLNRIYSQSRTKTNWALEPEVAQVNAEMETWLTDLPSDLRIIFPADSSLPLLPSHFVGNMHAYYHFALILLHRAHLNFSDPIAMGRQAKQHILTCYSSAKYLCRIQEAILQQFGMLGFLCMHGGASYTIYCVLACTVLHLFALISPDADLNSDSRDFFTRHMRILEQCSSCWHMPDVQRQINVLRHTFSADMNKPFVLKPAISFGGPGEPNLLTSTTSTNQGVPQAHLSGPSSVEPLSLLDRHQNERRHLIHPSRPVTPPVLNGNLPNEQSVNLFDSGLEDRSQQIVSATTPMGILAGWEPSKLLDQWDTIFSLPASQICGTTGSLSASSTSPAAMSANADISLASDSQAISKQTCYSPPIPSLMSPNIWQESFPSVHEGDLQSEWDYDTDKQANDFMYSFMWDRSLGS